ncbi:prevent-host-death protein [Chryseobacterium taklimakanense]|uniref:Prevent-host-death protein n=1 Tax=Chryseobacterium taklimakanense TaxID=536441 RepID=A0A239WVN7_9FLAO|nr:prevent-host-death protein [Chryseobacterium taklimakanense]AZI20037.1 prevent-host-death protein [Chryseobacterium taklimakanense]MCG7280744.1 prevent-host-death protein [Chryseobacterium taklimakanense]SNV38210.1 Uncharacterised protein [Chryseobacterium taklimakanense]
MDNNRFKESQNFDNLESNKANNPNLDTNPNQLAKDYAADMRSKNQEATHEGFMNHAKNTCPPDDWSNKQKEYDDAWKRNAEQVSGDDE